MAGREPARRGEGGFRGCRHTLSWRGAAASSRGQGEKSRVSAIRLAPDGGGAESGFGGRAPGGGGRAARGEMHTRGRRPRARPAACTGSGAPAYLDGKHCCCQLAKPGNATFAAISDLARLRKTGRSGISNLQHSRLACELRVPRSRDMRTDREPTRPAGSVTTAQPYYSRMLPPTRTEPGAPHEARHRPALHSPHIYMQDKYLSTRESPVRVPTHAQPAARARAQRASALAPSRRGAPPSP